MKRAISVFLTLAIVFTLPAYAFAMSESEWNEYWRKRMDLNQSVMLNFKVLEVR